MILKAIQEILEDFLTPKAGPTERENVLILFKWETGPPVHAGGSLSGERLATPRKTLHCIRDLFVPSGVETQGRQRPFQR